MKIFYFFTDYRTCNDDDVKCGNGLCVPKEKKCDGYFDCRDKSDENDCPGTSCDLSEFRCANGEKCIAEFQKCNHRKECTDGSDEEDCSKLLTKFSLKLVRFTKLCLLLKA